MSTPENVFHEIDAFCNIAKKDMDLNRHNCYFLVKYVFQAFLKKLTKNIFYRASVF